MKIICSMGALLAIAFWSAVFGVVVGFLLML